MTSASLLHVLSAHRRLLLAGALLGVLLAVLAALFVPPTYDSTTSIYVTARSSSGDDPTSAYQGTLLSQDRIASYRALATSHRVLVPVVEQQGRAEPAEDLAGRISVTAAPESTVLSLTVSGPDPVQDAETANAVARRLVAVVGELERSARSGVQLETVDPARPAVRPSSPGLATTAPVAAVAGLIVAAGWLWSGTRPTAGSATGCPPSVGHRCSASCRCTPGEHATGAGSAPPRSPTVPAASAPR